MNKEISDLIERKSILIKEADAQFEKASTDEELDKCDEKLEEIKSLDAKIEKLKLIESKKSYIKELKAKSALSEAEDKKKDTDEEDLEEKQKETEEDKIEEKEKRMSINSFNINKDITLNKIDPSIELGLNAVGSMFVKKYGPTDAHAMLKKDSKISEKLASRIVTKATTTTSEPIIPQDMRGYIEALYADSVIAQIAPVIQMPQGQVTILRESGLVDAAYIDEGEQFPYSEAAWDRIFLTWKKCAGMTSITKEVASMSPFEIASRIQRQLSRNIALRTDNAMLNNLTTGSKGNMPIGLAGLTLASNKLTGTASKLTTFASVQADLGRMVATLENNVIGSDGAVFIMSPAVKNALMFFANDYQKPYTEELSRGTLFGRRVLTTTQLASNNAITATGATESTNTGSTIYLVQPEYLRLGESGSYEAEQTNVGGWNAGGVQVNAFSQDLLAFKATVRHDFNVTQPNAIVSMDVDNWSLGNLASIANSLNFTPSTAGTTASGAIGKN